MNKQPEYPTEFIDSLLPVMACPYCGDVIAEVHDDSLKATHPCCGEMHIERAYVEPEGQELLLYDKDMWIAFQDWQEKEDSKEELRRLDGDRPDSDYEEDR